MDEWYSRLTGLMTPPEHPIRPSPEDWVEVQGVLGELPEDYKWFANHYGVGSVDDFIGVKLPGAGNRHLDLGRAAIRQIEIMRSGGDDGPFFPDAGGLLPFALTDNGDVIYWRTDERGPEHWTVVVQGSRDPEERRESFGSSLVPFLVDVLSGRVQPRSFPEDFPGPGPVSFRRYAGAERSSEE